MFNFIQKYILKDSQEKKTLRNFDDVISNINFYLKSLDFIKAKAFIDEIREKEKKIFTNFIKDLSLSPKEIKKAQKIYDAKMKKLDKLEEKYKKLKRKYDEDLEKKKTEIRIKKVEHKL
jgi:hypothetical protein